MELGNKHAVVMTRDGEFIRVARRRQAWQLGEEIDVPNLVRKRPILMTSIASACAAAVILLFVMLTGPGGLGGPGQPVVAAYITMDINPSIELSVDADEVVLEARGLNEDGAAVLAELSLRGVPLEEAADMIVDRAAELDYLEKYTELGAGTILITSTNVLEEQETEEEELLERVTQRVKQTMVAKHPEEAQVFEVESLAAPNELRVEAEKNGVSVGKLAIQILAEEHGQTADEQSTASASVQSIVQSVGGVGKLLQETKKQDKEHWKQLLDAYKKRHPDLVSGDDSKTDTEDDKDKAIIPGQSGTKGNGNGPGPATDNGNGNKNGNDKGKQNGKNDTEVGAGIGVDVDLGQKNQGSTGKDKPKADLKEKSKGTDKPPAIILDVELDLDLGVLKDIKNKVEQKIEKEKAKQKNRGSSQKHNGQTDASDRGRDDDRGKEDDNDRPEESAKAAGSDDRFSRGLLDKLFNKDKEKDERGVDSKDNDRGNGSKGKDNGKVEKD